MNGNIQIREKGESDKMNVLDIIDMIELYIYIEKHFL
jgi:hypothetical protein